MRMYVIILEGEWVRLALTMPRTVTRFVEGYQTSRLLTGFHTLCTCGGRRLPRVAAI